MKHYIAIHDHPQGFHHALLTSHHPLESCSQEQIAQMAGFDYHPEIHDSGVTLHRVNPIHIKPPTKTPMQKTYLKKTLGHLPPGKKVKLLDHRGRVSRAHWRIEKRTKTGIKVTYSRHHRYLSPSTKVLLLLEDDPILGQ